MSCQLGLGSDILENEVENSPRREKHDRTDNAWEIGQPEVAGETGKRPTTGSRKNQKRSFRVGMPADRISRKELNPSGRFCSPIRSASRSPDPCPEAAAAPSARASGTKSERVAANCEPELPLRSRSTSSPRKARLPRENQTTAPTMDTLALPSGTRTSAMAARSAPPPNAMTKWRNSLSSHPGCILSIRASDPPTGIMAPAIRVRSAIWRGSFMGFPELACPSRSRQAEDLLD